MINYCTLFDANYLAQGLALYESMDRHHEDYQLHILTLCKKSFTALEKLDLPNVILHSVVDVETAELRNIHSRLSNFEYACALKPSFIMRILQNAEHAVYIDADSYFFSTGKYVIDSLRANNSISIAITSHRFTPSRNHFIVNGNFNAGFIYATCNGIPCLMDWDYLCVIDRKGPMTDQLHLNDWPERWGAYIIKHEGLNLAPWNQSEQYQYSMWNDQIYVNDYPLVWYHFHQGLDPNYTLDKFVAHYIYKPYKEVLSRAKELSMAMLHPKKKTLPVIKSSPVIEISKPKKIKRPHLQMRNYCTYFDGGNLVSFLAMYESMVKWCKPFKLWAMALDDITLNNLKKLNLEYVSIVPMFYRSNQNMRELKLHRSHKEYVRMFKPLLLQYMMRQDLDSITYLDPNGYFFARPDDLYREIAAIDIAITPHRFNIKYTNNVQTEGKFNTGFMYFRKGKKATFDCIVEWCKQIMERCECSPGYFFDQKYIGNWSKRWGAHVIQHKGVNLAPWNQGGQYKYEMRGNSPRFHLYVDNDPLIWYNFSEDNGYKIDDLLQTVVYAPYKKALREARSRV